MTKLFDFSQIIDHSTHAKVILDSGNIVYANQAFSSLLGCQNPEEMLTENIFTFIHPSFHEERLTRLLRGTHGNLAEFNRLKMVGIDGQIIDVEFMAAPYIHVDEVLVQGIIRDLTAGRKHEELLRHSEQLSLIEELASKIAKDIRNPLTSIDGFLHLFKSYPKNEYIDIIFQELKQLEEIANELLYFSETEKNPLTQQNILDITRKPFQVQSRL
ncbi:MAG: PAS domain-containing protein [Bacillota bacterium]